MFVRSDRQGRNRRGDSGTPELGQVAVRTIPARRGGRASGLATRRQHRQWYRNPRTVRDTYLAAIKAVFRWAKGNAKIAINPTADLQIRVPKRRRTREAGFTDEEAILILRATLEPPPKKLSPERVFARRWIPWLCAYSGARVREIAQLRREDVKMINGIWTMKITPEAGSVKNDNFREVPFHPHLIEQGFLEEALAREGPLFFNPARRVKYRDCVNWDLADQMITIGGVRFEDDILVTDGAPENLTAAIPKGL